MNCQYIDEDTGETCSNEIDITGHHAKRQFCDYHRKVRADKAIKRSQERARGGERIAKPKVRKPSADWPERRAAIVAQHGVPGHGTHNMTGHRFHRVTKIG